MPIAYPSPRRLRPTDVLKHEHRQIEERLAELSQSLRELGDRGPEAAILDRIESIASFIDNEMAVHHRKEEEGLFPLIAPHLDESLPIDGKVADHEDLNIMNGKFKQAIDECRRCEPGSAGRFAAQMLKGYGLYIVHLVLEHLLKEDQILFLIADRFLTPEQESQALERFRAIDASMS